MAFIECEARRLAELHRKIESESDPDYAVPTFRAVPALKEMERIVEERLAKDGDRQTLRGSAAAFEFIARSYKDMGRAAVSARFYRRALELCVQIRARGESFGNVRDLFYSAVRARNVYVDDDCGDLAQLCRPVLTDSEIFAEIESVKKSRRSFLQDPVEMSEAYLSVIDEVDELVDRAREIRGKGTCFERWQLKRKYLGERGVVWHSPAVLNPGVHFD